MISVAEARAIIEERCHLRTASEEIALADAGNRFTSSDVAAPIDLPRWDQSAMDGFAIRLGDVPGSLPIAGTIAAGDVPGASLTEGATLKIMTGAPTPAGTEAVVIREDVDDRGSLAVFTQGAKAGQNIRRAGEDIARGSIAVPRGVRLGSAELSILGALGLTRVPVHARPRVAIIATGDELVPIGEEAGPGQKIASSTLALAFEVERAGGIVTHASIAGDDRAALRASIDAATKLADIVLTTGGVSAGDYDFVVPELEHTCFERHFHKVAIKPGKPLLFATSPAQQLFFGLPGNPVSSMVTFELFVRPALLKVAGAIETNRLRLPVRLATPYSKRAGRAHYLRAALLPAADGMIADISRNQGSGRLRSMVAADVLVEIPAEVQSVDMETVVIAYVIGPP